MAAQLYSNTKLAESLFDVLNEMVAEGLLNEDLAVQTLSQVMQGMHSDTTMLLLWLKENSRTDTSFSLSCSWIRYGAIALGISATY